MRILVAIGVLSVLNCSASANVTVRIVDYPPQVLRYSPVFVTGEVRNEGAEPILIPATNFTANRYVVETGTDEATLKELRPFASSGGGSVVSIAPGASWFFMEDIGPWVKTVGSVYIRLGIQSGGECQYRASGSESFPLRVVEKQPGIETYSCWRGRVSSELVRVEVVEPSDPNDLAALEYVRSPEFPVGCCLDNKFGYRLQFGFGALADRFPTSNYTYFGGFYACQKSAECLQRLLDAQPANPLTPYTKLQHALAAVRDGRSRELTPSAIAALSLPPGLADYLLQETTRAEARSPKKPSPTLSH